MFNLSMKIWASFNDELTYYTFWANYVNSHSEAWVKSEINLISDSCLWSGIWDSLIKEKNVLSYSYLNAAEN